MHRFLQYLCDKRHLPAKEGERISKLAISEGVDVKRAMLSEGIFSPYKLYSLYARFLNMDYANLEKELCDYKLLEKKDQSDYLRLRAIPWKRENGVLYIAVSELTDEIKQWAECRYKQPYKFCITSPFDIHMCIYALFGEQDSLDACERLFNTAKYYCARSLDWLQKLFSVLLLGAFFILLSAVVFESVFMLLVFLSGGVYILIVLFKVVLFLAAFFWRSSTIQMIDTPDRDLPIYTLLIPLYREERVLPQLISALSLLDYPKSKLDVKIIVEEDDIATIKAFKHTRCERYMELIRVPASLPRTKPKALNYALRFAKGDYVVIYDAEDIPEDVQLKKVLSVFSVADEDVGCVQAKLAYYNRMENILTQWFGLEYAQWFAWFLPGLCMLRMPIPLGGTSNHFKRDVLEKLCAWDPYNVTEDADLGLRAYRMGYRVAIVDSITEEEAPISCWAWIRQRSRWIKGHLQTYFVHMQHPLQLLRDVKWHGFFAIQLFIGLPCFVYLLSPLIWIGVFSGFSFWAMLLLSVVWGIHILFSLCVVVQMRWWRMFFVALIFPAYWFLHSIASYKAVWELFRRPFYWEKTEHGFSPKR